MTLITYGCLKCKVKFERQTPTTRCEYCGSSHLQIMTDLQPPESRGKTVENLRIETVGPVKNPPDHSGTKVAKKLRPAWAVREFSFDAKEAYEEKIAVLQANPELTIVPVDEPDYGLVGRNVWHTDPEKTDLATPEAGWYYYPIHGKTLDPEYTDCKTLEELISVLHRFENEAEGAGAMKLAVWPATRRVGFRHEGAVQDGVMRCVTLDVRDLYERHGRNLTRSFTWEQQLAYHIGQFGAFLLMQKLAEEHSKPQQFAPPIPPNADQDGAEESKKTDA